MSVVRLSTINFAKTAKIAANNNEKLYKNLRILNIFCPKLFLIVFIIQKHPVTVFMVSGV
jgi:hypothetical protein